MSAWLHVVGIGEDGLDGLGAAARRIVVTAEVLIGGARHLAMVPERRGSGVPESGLSWSEVPELGVPRSEVPGLEAAGLEDRGLEVRGSAVRGSAVPESDVLGPHFRRTDVCRADRAVPELGSHKCERLKWPRPFDALAREITRRRGRRICVLASGDPLCFGVAATLRQHFDVSDMRIWPAPSAFSLARAKMGWSASDAVTLSVHGRPLELLEPEIQPDARMLVLSHDGASPSCVAARLVQRGFGPSEITVLEHLGGAAERVRMRRAEAFDLTDVAPLNCIAVHCVAGSDPIIRACVPGLPDDAFRHDGQLTKRIVRAATLSALAPWPGALLWDVGAGCGSVAIEWMRAAPRCRAVAIERNADRAENISSNARALGVPHLQLVAAAAPAALGALASPDAVFIGGAVADATVFDACWEALAPGGRLVANAVSLQGETALIDRHARYGGALDRIAVSHAETVGRFDVMRPAYAVTMWSVTR